MTHFFLAAISADAVWQCFIWLIIAGVIFFLLNWLIAYTKLQEPFLTVARVVIGVAVVFFVINALMVLVGRPLIG